MVPSVMLSNVVPAFSNPLNASITNIKQRYIPFWLKPRVLRSEFSPNQSKSAVCESSHQSSPVQIGTGGFFLAP